jgi:hypothetical protein
LTLIELQVLMVQDQESEMIESTKSITDEKRVAAE